MYKKDLIVVDDLRPKTIWVKELGLWINNIKRLFNIEPSQSNIKSQKYLFDKKTTNKKKWKIPI